MSYCLLVKKNKKDTNWKQRNETSSKHKEKTKSHNPFLANQPQAQASKKRQCWRGGPLATRVNTIKVAKKDKDKAKDLNHIKYYICKQKDHHASKYPKKAKNKWQSWQPLRQ